MQKEQNPTEDQHLEQDADDRIKKMKEELREAVKKALELLATEKLKELSVFYDKVEEKITWKTFLPPNEWALLRSGIGVYYHKEKNYKKAISIFQEILSVITKDKNSVSDDVKGTTFLNLADNYNELRQYQKAIDYAIKAMPFFEVKAEKEENALQKLLDAYYLMHTGYFELRQNKKSIEYNLKTLELLEKYKSHDDKYKSICLANISVAYFRLRNHRETMKYIELSIPLMSKHSLEHKTDIEEMKTDYISCMQQIFPRMSPIEKSKYRNFIYEYIYDDSNKNTIDHLLR